MAVASLDVTGLQCPMTWVRTKLALERLDPGEELAVSLPAGEALDEVPRSARAAGHDVRLEGTVARIVKR